MKVFTALLFILSLSLHADSSEWFVGLSGGGTGAKMANKELNSSYQFGPEYGVKVGFREGLSRVYVGYTIAHNIGTEVSKTQSPYIALEGIGEEFTVMGASTAKFYFGVRAGGSFATVNESKNSAFLGGLQTGLIFMLPADFELELEYRHYWSYKSSKETDFNAGAVALGLNYKFSQN